MSNIIELYDSWTFLSHENYVVQRILVLPYSELIKNENELCLLDVIRHCRDGFLTMNCQLKFRRQDKNKTKQRTIFRQIDYPIMIGSELARIVDNALHARELILEVDQISAYKQTILPCLERLKYLHGIFIINGVAKHLPTHVYLRNRQIHVNNKNEVVYYHYYKTDRERIKRTVKKSPAVATISDNNGRQDGQNISDVAERKLHTTSDKIIYNRDQNKFYRNKKLVSEDDISNELRQNHTLMLDEYESEFPDGILYWMKNCQPISFDDLRMKLFYTPGHILWLLRDYALKTESNSNNVFKKGITTGNVKFLFSATAKFIPVIARETGNENFGCLSGDSVQSVFRELCINNPLYSQSITQSVTKLTSGYACNSIERRLIHESELNYLCVYSNTHGHKIGLNVEFARNCQVSGWEGESNWPSTILQLIVKITDRLALSFPSQASVNSSFEPAAVKYVYIILNSVPIFKRVSINVERDIVLLYFALKNPIKNLAPYVEFRHDGYTALFLNILPGLIVKNNMTSAERDDFAKRNVDINPTDIFSENIHYLPYYRYNPPAKNIFVLHSFRGFVQQKRSDIDFLNFSDYPYLINSDVTETGIDGFLLDTIYMPFRELTAEDGLIISKSAGLKMSYRYLEQIRVTVSDCSNYPCLHVQKEDEIVVDSQLITFFDPVKVKMTRKCYFVNDGFNNITFLSNRSGRIIEKRVLASTKEYTLVLILENTRAVMVGDKLLSLNGQKSVIAGIIDDELLPRRLYDGKVPDVIGCPEMLGTRFTLGQLREAISHGGHDVFMKGYDKPVFWGRVFYCMLHHFVYEKFSSFKDKISVSMLSKQPGKARVRNSGVRLGLSELSALESYGMSSFIYNKFIRESDGEVLFHCSRQGCIHNARCLTRLRGHHRYHRGYFRMTSFTVKRCIEDYAIVGIDLRERKRLEF